jgi:transcriptional regulator with XRE-family HTH domain
MTNGERLELSRRRADMTQAAAAYMYGVAPSRYRAWEKDQGRNPPTAPAADLSPGEWCWLMRRRSGLTLHQVAERSNLEPKWIHRVERRIYDGDRATPLVVWWQLEGLG